MTEETKETVPFSDWEKLDLRVGKIEKVEDIPEADKLYKLTINLGKLGKRIVCAGIKQHYKKEQLKNHKAISIIVMNFQDMRGLGWLLLKQCEMQNR